MVGRSPPPPPLLTFLFFFLFSVVALGAVNYQLSGISYAAASSSTSTTIVRCHASERNALMGFKRRLLDPSHRLSSWVGEDCCAWEGVGCSNVTGRVLKLDLRNRHMPNRYVDCAFSNYNERHDTGCKWSLQGEISDSLLSLQHLRHLDLSANFFQGKPIPEHLGSLRSLTYLNLSIAGFIGRVPAELGNLTHLHCLDLSYNPYDDDYVPAISYLKDGGWISQLTSLRHLKMNGVSFANASNWLEALNSLPHIQVLELSKCGLLSVPDLLPRVNFTSLISLDLSENYEINSTAPEWLFNITSLQHLFLGGTMFYWAGVPISIAKLTSLRTLDLSSNVFQNGTKTAEALSNLCNLKILILRGVSLDDELFNLHVVFANSCLVQSLEELDLSYANLHGFLPNWLGSMKNLEYLDLSSNSLEGSLPISLQSMKNLRHLDLSYNSFNGSLPLSLQSLALLQHLDVSGNGLNGTIAQGMFEQMKGLVSLDIRGNSLSLSDAHLANLSSLKFLDISKNSYVVNDSYHEWIPPFQLESLHMDSCKILPKPQIPKWIQTQRALLYLGISSVGIQGNISIWLPDSLQDLDLSNNQITGHLPHHLHNIINLDLSNNSFTGQLYFKIAKIMSNIGYLDLSMNNLSGSISSSFCQLEFLFIFRIYNNKLWGSKLPNCWKNSSRLQIIDISNNKLQGEMPRSLCNLQLLEMLHLNNNDLSGRIPSCLEHCTELATLDLSHNHFTGSITTWVREGLSQLQRLILRFNAFSGSIPLQLAAFSFLQILDLSNNNLSGIIPSNFGNFSALKDDSFGNIDYDDRTWLFMKGEESEYVVDLLALVKFIDLSNNRFTGHIPKELGDLYGLQSLNLSKNYLTGEVPSSFKGLQKLEILDLSENDLSGVIPPNLAVLTFLNHLNLSYNNFSGEIPTGSQLQTFDSSSYIGNPNLCGFPLPKNCSNSTAKGDDDDEEQEEDANNKIEIIFRYMSISLGFIVGFWIMCGILILQKGLRSAYFRYIDNTYDKIYVTVAVKLASFSK